MNIRTGPRVLLLLLTAVLIALTAACSPAPAAKSAAPEVATMETKAPGAKATSTAPAPDAGRPRERLDMTPAEYNRIYAPYLDCLRDHGVEVGENRDQQAGPQYAIRGAENKRAFDKVAGSCDNKVPLPAWELDPKNPDAIAFGRKVVACLRAKGVKYVELSTDSDVIGPALGGPHNDEESIAKGMDLLPECQREVANK